MTILCEFDETTAAGITPGLGGAVRLTASLPEAALGIAEDDAENLLLIGPDVPLEQVLDFMGKLRAERPALGVILVRRSYDRDEVAAALQAGVREVVPDEPVALLDACRRVAGDEPGPPHGQIVTVFSPKGGSGKTTLATNIAAALSRLAPPVCLVDLDLEFGDVAISLGLAPTRTLADAVKVELDGDDVDPLAMLTTDYDADLKCILAPVEPGDAARIPAELVADLLPLLRARYAYVVVDTPSQLSPHVLAALDLSDHHVLLTNPEIPALKNLRLTLDMLDLLRYARDRRSVIFNRADPAAGISAKEVEDMLKMPVTTQVPASRDVPASINRGVPIVAAHKDHPVSQAISRFAAARIVGEPAGAGKRTRRRILGRRAA